MADLGRQLEAELEGLQAQGLMGIQGLGSSRAEGVRLFEVHMGFTVLGVWLLE